MTIDEAHDLARFVEAQKGDYERAFSEISSGRKLTHWMWYIFPQIAGLAHSPTSIRFAIKGVAEARAYLDHAVLGPRLIGCTEALLDLTGLSATEIFGTPDDLKLRSSATLFAFISPPASVFDRLIGKYFDGERDVKTLALLAL